MKIVILLHSTTGNTKLVTKYAAGLFADRQHEVRIVDITKDDAVSQPEEIDLLGVASPTLYFRASFAMERFLARMPSLPKGVERPAFLLGTCAGEPGAHFPLLAEMLAHKGFSTLGAHWVLAPSNWPSHLNIAKFFAPTERIGMALGKQMRSLRPLLAAVWAKTGEPDGGDRRKLDRFIKNVAERAEGKKPLDVPKPSKLPHAIPYMDNWGRVMTMEKAARSTALSFDANACTRCMTCVEACPMECLAIEEGELAPIVKGDCCGCWTCYNVCRYGAVSGLAAPRGGVRYEGPSPGMKRLFEGPAVPPK